MAENKNNIDKLFEHGLKNYEEKAPSHSWDVLDAKLQQQKKMRYMRILRYAAASVLVLLAFFVGQEYPNITTTSENLMAEGESNQQAVNETHDLPKLLSVAAIRTPAAINTEKAKTSRQKSERITNEVINNHQIAETRAEEKISFLTLKAFDKLTTQVADALKVPENYLRRMLHDPDNELIAAVDNQPVANRNEDRSWEVGGFFAPVYSYRTTEDQSFGLFDNSYKSNTNGPGSFEQGQIAFAAGITAQLDLNRKWTVESGVFYARMGQSKNTLVFQNKASNGGDIDLSTSAGRIDGSKLPQSVNAQVSDNTHGPDYYITTEDMDTKLHQQFDFIEIPMLLKYEVFNEDVAINLISGLTTGVLVNNTTYLDIEGDRSNLGSTKNLRKFLYSGVVGFGMQYEINKGLFINMEPTFKYALHSMNPSREYKYKPYSLGINTGISIGF